MKDVRYFAPKTVEEALRILAEHGGRATILAGGTDIVPRIKARELRPEVLVYIGGLGLDNIREEQGGELVIGACTPTADIAASKLLADKAGALAEAARQSGCTATRSSATIGGNLANASPAADMATPLMAMDAEVALKGVDGDRRVPLADFFKAPGSTVLNPTELIISIHIPPVGGRTVFLKLGRRKAMTLSVANVAVRVELNGDTCKDVAIALGAMAPTPIRCARAEEMLKGRQIDDSAIDACASAAVADSKPIDDVRASAWYRRRACTALVRRALSQAAGLDK